MIWYLILYNAVTPPFEGGQYQSRAKCEAAAQVQVAVLRDEQGRRLSWRCELDGPIGSDRTTKPELELYGPKLNW